MGRGLGERSQVRDYRLRSPELEDMNVIDYFVETFEDVISESDTHPRRSNRGPPKLARYFYHETHEGSTKYLRKRRSAYHNHMPNFIGMPFPRYNDETRSEYYCATMLLLLKPWRDPTDLKAPHRTWKAEFNDFTSSAHRKVIRIIENINQFHRGKDAADRERALEYQERPTANTRPLVEAGDIDILDNAGNRPDQQETSMDVTEADWEMMYAQAISSQGEAHAREAVFLAEMSGFFADKPFTAVPSASNAIGSDVRSLQDWVGLLQLPSSSVNNTDSAEGHRDSNTGSTSRVEKVPLSINGRVDAIARPEAPLEALGIDLLNADQKRAYDIISCHFKLTQQQESPRQLLMFLHGEGGTGKSRVIQTITDMYARRGCSHMLAKVAFTGIAASLIEGETIHRSLKLGRNHKTIKEIDGRKRKELEAKWSAKHLLIIDEDSMVSKEFLALISYHLQVGRAGLNDSALPFGGLNIMICGDFCQFPPVQGRERAALFTPPAPNASDTEKAGWALFQQFDKCVLLKEQKRVTDPIWSGFLGRLRLGTVTSEDLMMLKGLILKPDSMKNLDSSWSTAKLVTPRHAVKDKWNLRALEKHSQATGNQIFVWDSVITVDKQEADDLTKLEYVRHKLKHKKTSMSSRMQLAVGAEVLVTLNVDPDIDVANGSRAVVEKIVLHPDEPPFDLEQVVHLEHMPLYILVKLERTRAVHLPGLEPGVIPIQPHSLGASKIVIEREPQAPPKSVIETQFPLALGYAFTDYRAQGQTIPKVIIDIADPKSGGHVNPFNAYVALSRGVGRDSIRLLREFSDDLFKRTFPTELLDVHDRLGRLDQSTNLRELFGP